MVLPSPRARGRFRPSAVEVSKGSGAKGVPSTNARAAGSQSRGQTAAAPNSTAPAGSGGASGGTGTSGAASGGAATGSSERAAGRIQTTSESAPMMGSVSPTIDTILVRGSVSLHVQTQGNGHAHLARNGGASQKTATSRARYVPLQVFPTAADYAHFTLVEAAGTGPGLIRPIGGQYMAGTATAWGWIDQQAKADPGVSKQVHKGNSVDFVFPTFNTLWFGCTLYPGGSARRA